MITLFLWDVYKSDMRICFPCRLVESHEKGAGFMWPLVGVSVYIFCIKYPSSSSHKPYFVDFWPVCFSFTASSLIDPETCTQLWLQVVCGPYKNWTSLFAYTSDLWKVVARVSVFISLSIINWLTGFKAISSKVSCLVFWSVFTFIYL